MPCYICRRRSGTNTELWKGLRDALERYTDREPVLLYQASWDGSSARVFHERCDHKGSTVTFAFLENGSIFGAYVDLDWSSPPGSALVAMDVPNSVLFSYREKEGLRFSPKHEDGIWKRSGVSAHLCATMGPSLGSGPDFEVHFGRSMMLTGTPGSYQEANIPLPWADLKDVEVWAL